MCDQCGNPQTPEEIANELGEMELEYLGSRDGAVKIKRMLTGISNGKIIIAQEIEIHAIDENGVSKEDKTSIVYVTPELLITIVEGLIEGGEESG